MSCYCYIVECADGTYYTGWTVNPEKRVTVHNQGRGARYTRTRCPVRLVYIEELPDRTSAMKREIAIKKMTHAGKDKLIGGSVYYPVDKYTVKQKP
ncbi:MAG TPA: GIY-YIG nuclease family protein [Anaerolineales bacterium]